MRDGELRSSLCHQSPCHIPVLSIVEAGTLCWSFHGHCLPMYHREAHTAARVRIWHWSFHMTTMTIRCRGPNEAVRTEASTTSGVPCFMPLMFFMKCRPMLLFHPRASASHLLNSNVAASSRGLCYVTSYNQRFTRIKTAPNTAGVKANITH